MLAVSALRPCGPQTMPLQREAWVHAYLCACDVQYGVELVPAVCDVPHLLCIHCL